MTDNHFRQTLSQRRAGFALKQVRLLENELFANKFRSYAANLPPMIQMNGFGQALAFCRSKANGASKEALAYERLYGLISEWLDQKGQPYAGKGDALHGIVNGNMSVYRLAQTETLALLDWVKRFASAFIEDRDDRSDAEPTPDASPRETSDVPRTTHQGAS